MMRQGVCKYCSESLRANGDNRFKDAVNNHFENKHIEEHKHLTKLFNDARKEVRELEDKYPELYFVYLDCQINWDKLLSIPETIG